MAMTGGAVAQDQLEDLRERMRLLQGDRKANVDILEANKAANKDEIKRLREENKQVRMALSALQSGSKAENRDLALQVIKSRKAYDSLREQVKTKERTLAKLKDDISDLEMLSKRPNAEDSPVTRNIRVLENRLDKALIKYNEAQSIKKTYEQIVKRLREERIGFDHQLAALERTFAAKQRDYEELLLLSGDANHARQVAQSELEHVRGGYEEERKRRESELRERHQAVQLRKQTLERISKREKMRAEILARERSGDADGAPPGSPNFTGGDAANARLADADAISKERLEQRTKIDIFEAAFRKIKEATGVSDVNEVIQKIVSQESTTENLMGLTKENQARIEALNEQKQRIKSHVEEIKYSGPGGGHRRKLVDDHEEQLAAAAARAERQRTKYERLARMVIAVKAGVKHLQDKLEGVREELGGKHLELTDETTAKVMSENEKMMLELLARIRVANDDELLVANATTNSLAASSQASPTAGGDDEDLDLDLDETELLRTRPYNRRIDLPLLDEDGATEDAQAEDLINNEVDDELTRDKVKKASSQILSAQEKKFQKAKAKAKRSKKDQDE